MKNQFIKSILYVSFLMSSLITFAQEEDPENPFEDPGTPAAPINSYILVLFFFGILWTYAYLKKYKKNTL